MALLLIGTVFVVVAVKPQRMGAYLVSLFWPVSFGFLNLALHPGPTISSQTSWLSDLGAPVRENLKLHAVGISRDAVALTLGITDGDTSLLTENLKEQFKLLSLTHLTAVSGTNCAILVAVISVTLGWLGIRRFWRVVLSVIVLLAYLALVGNQPSVIRAAIMSVVVLVGMNFGQRLRTINVLAFAVVLGLAIEPSFAINLGFQLSVAATAGVVMLAPKLATKLGAKVPKPLALLLSVAASAQLCCLPILISIQHNSGMGTLLANILAEPAVVPATVLGLVATFFTLIPTSFCGALASFTFSLATLPAAYLVSLSNWLSTSLPTVYLPANGHGVIWAVVLLIVVLVWVSRVKQIRRRLVPLTVLLAALTVPVAVSWFPSGKFAPRGWVMVACDVGQGDATVIRAGNDVALIDTGKDPVKINSCLRRLGVSRIALLQLTHFDLDHVGAVSQVLASHRVDRALLTQFPDVRPGALAVERILKHSHISTTRLALGDHGTLGPRGARNCFSWLALTPHIGGVGSSSSNEGSVAIFWHSAQLNVFTMADLPAAGQMRVMQELPMWWTEEYRRVPTVLKVSHHGSADQDAEFLQWVNPLISTISVGQGNSYGHPTQKTLNLLRHDSRITLRTDLLGSISITPEGHHSLVWGNTGVS